MENPQIVIDQVEKALQQLYSDPTQNDVASAEKWLILVQQSPQAWGVAWRLLEKQKVEIQNFGALLLQNKISKYWSELPPEQYEPMKVELFKAILKFSTGPKLILTRLCVAMVMYMFHAIPEVWPNALVSVITTLGTTSTKNPTNTTALLELLKILPEEFDRTNNELFAQKRVVLRKEIMEGRASVFSFLEQLLTNLQHQLSNSFASKQSVIDCIASWTTFSPPLPELKNLIALLFQNVLDIEVLPEASEALIKLVNHRDSFKYPSVLQQFLVHLLQTSDFINSQLQQEEVDMDVCCSLCYLATNILESNMSLLTEVAEDNAENSEEAIEGLQLVLGFTVLPGSFPTNEKCSIITLPFWEVFLDGLASEAHSQFLLDFYGSIINSLIEVFPIKSRYPSEEEWEQVWDESDRDDFLGYRDDLRDTGDSIQRTLHEEYVKHLSLLLGELFAEGNSPPWQAVESILFLLQGVARNVTEKTSAVFKEVLCFFPRMPTNKTLYKTALRLLGELSDWFTKESDTLFAVLPVILDSLSEPSLAASASLAFRDICKDCSHLLAPYVVQVIPSCQASLSNPQISAEDCGRVISAVGCVLSVLPLSSLSGPLEPLICSRIEALEQLAQQPPSTETYPLVFKELYILSYLCQHIYPDVSEGEQHPVMLMLIRVWPSLKGLLSKWIGDTSIVDIICSCIRNALRNTKYHYMPLIEDSTLIILQCFGASRHSGLLNAATELIKQFGCNQSCHTYLSSFLQQLLNQCFQLCQQGVSAMDPELLQSLLNLLDDTLISCPMLLATTEGMLHHSLNLSLASMQLPEHRSISAASSLLVTIINLSSVDIINKLITHRGRDIAECMLKGVAGGIDRSQLEHVSSVIFALVQNYVEGLAVWLEELLSQSGFPSLHPSAVEKEMFKSSILRAQGSKTVVREKVSEFSLICRGFHGTLYAAETSKSLMNQV